MSKLTKAQIGKAQRAMDREQAKIMRQKDAAKKKRPVKKPKK